MPSRPDAGPGAAGRCGRDRGPGDRGRREQRDHRVGYCASPGPRRLSSRSARLQGRRGFRSAGPEGGRAAPAHAGRHGPSGARGTTRWSVRRRTRSTVPPRSGRFQSSDPVALLAGLTAAITVAAGAVRGRNDTWDGDLSPVLDLAARTTHTSRYAMRPAILSTRHTASPRSQALRQASSSRSAVSGQARRWPAHCGQPGQGTHMMLTLPAAAHGTGT